MDVICDDLSSLPVSDQRLRDIGDDAAQKRARPAGLPRQLRGHRGRGGAVRIRLAGRAAAGQPIGGDLQGCRGNALARADDRSTAHLRYCEGGDHTASRGRHAPQVHTTTR